MKGATLNYRSLRSKKSHLASRLDGPLSGLLDILISILIVTGILLILFSHLPIGWLVLAAAVSLGMVSIWYRLELRQLSPAQNFTTIDSVLESNILGRLSPDTDLLRLIDVSSDTPEGQFFSSRFGLTKTLLNNLASQEGLEISQLWVEAINLRSELNESQITSGLIIIALFRLHADYKKVLAQMRLNETDLIEGIHWYRHLSGTRNHFRKPNFTGGVARDWAFGYIPTLLHYGQNISEQISFGSATAVELQANQAILDQIVRVYSSNGRQAIALVGQDGVGKTSLVYALAAYLVDTESKLSAKLRYRQIFMLSAASLIADSPGRGELEQLMIKILNEAHNAENIIIFLENAELFFEDDTGSVDLSNLLKPIIEAGNLRMILTIDQQKFIELNARQPNLVNSLNRINVLPAKEYDTKLILQDELIAYEYQHRIVYTHQALQEIYRLSERYIFDLAQPGKSVKLLEIAAGYSEAGLVTVDSVYKAIENTLGIKVGLTDASLEGERLLNLENLIHQRMVNQSRAVSVVSDALRRARTGVRNENRPIGTFLFLGPTGVGKTELAKALSEVYFDGEDNLIRLDLNELVRAEDASRLIGDAADAPDSLTAQVIKKPFSVILLDEIEKAHPAVLMNLLQVLDEGVLRDIKNREISFRDAVIIATSNAGAAVIRQAIEKGYKLEQFEESLINNLIDSGQFKPEFLNRFDEIVLFRPLDKQELLEVSDIILNNLNKTLSTRGATVIVPEDVKVLLVESSYDPRLGARPLRRIIQQTIENIIANQMLSGEVGVGSEIKISLEQVQAELAKKP